VEAQFGSQAKVEFIGISADTPQALRQLADELKLSFPLLSDPQLQSADVLGAKTSSGHPRALAYPRKAFLQPSVFIYTKVGEPAFKWIMKPGFFNLFGAARRMTPEEIAKKVNELSV
jgi:peroxiredoxin